MRSLCLLGAVALAGCSASDPCDGQSGTCVSARIEGMPSMLDQLRVSVDGQPAPMPSPVQPAGSFSLPVRIAIVFASPPASPAAITVEGLQGGAVVASSGKQSVPLVSGGRSSFTFTLAPGGGDGGVLDGPPGDGPPDLTPPPNVVSIEPGSFTFPDTPRQTKSSTLATLLFTNNTNHPVTVTGMDGGGMPAMDNSFNFDASSTCPLMMGMTTFAANQSCTLVISFTPDVSGPIEADIVLFFDDGETVSLILKGKGLPVWSGESPSGVSTSFNAVWASGPNDWWAVGSDPSQCPVWQSSGTGQWHTMPNCGMVTTHNLYSVGGTSPTDVWFGGDNGTIWHWDGVSITSQVIDGATTKVTGIADFGTKNAVAVTSGGNIFCIGSNGGWGGCPPFGMTNGFGAAQAVGGVNGEDGYLVVGEPGVAWLHFANAGNWTMIPNVPAGLAVNGAWVANNAKLDTFVVGQSGTAGVILHYLSSSGTNSEMPGQSQGGLFAVSGRITDTMGNYEVYAVGGIGNQVLRSTGNGQWSGMQIPIMQGLTMRAVFVLPNGHLVVAGDAGQIAHFY